MLLISVRCPGHASGVSLADVTAAVIRGAAADRRLRVTLSRREQSMQCDSRQVRLVRPNALVNINLKYKVLPYSLPSVGPGADPGVQAQPAHDLKPYTRRYRLPLLSARPAVTFPAERRHRPSAGTKLYCFTEDMRVSSLPKDVVWKRTGRDSNPRPLGSRANALSLSYTSHLI